MNLIEHKDKPAMIGAMANAIAEDLQNAIAEHGSAHLLVSGGSSPKPMFAQLSERDIDWNKVLIGLVDERFVPTEHEKSNFRLINEHLLINKAEEATAVGMVYDDASYEENLEHVVKAYEPFINRIDVSVLGMGTDGHTASLFPNDPASQKALSEDFIPALANTSADVEPFQRITCSMNLLHRSGKLYLLINGTQKREVLNSALEKQLPIASFFETEDTELITHYTKEA